ncbi:MAG: hypothetical protein AAF498_01365 [Pseudomonadota bacterium]
MKRAIVTAGILAMTTTGIVMNVAVAQPPAAEVDRWAVRLAEVDTDGDGAISKAESEARREAAFTDADANGDGVLSPDEITTFRAAERETRRMARQSRVFSRLDLNEDGFIDADEFAVPGDRRFERADVDGDGIITQAEAEDAHENRRQRRHRGPVSGTTDAG